MGGYDAGRRACSVSWEDTTRAAERVRAVGGYDASRRLLRFAADDGFHPDGGDENGSAHFVRGTAAIPANAPDTVMQPGFRGLFYCLSV